MLYSECAKRWKQCLDPQLDRSEWTELEVGLYVHGESRIVMLIRTITEPTIDGGMCCQGATMERDSDGAFPYPVTKLDQESVSMSLG